VVVFRDVIMYTVQSTQSLHLKVKCRLQLKCDGTRQTGVERGNCRMQFVARTLDTTLEYGVYSITTADVHTSAPSNRLN
jgi:hypothetical protein